MGGSHIASVRHSAVVHSNITLPIYLGAGFVSGGLPHHWLESSLAGRMSHTLLPFVTNCLLTVVGNFADAGDVSRSSVLALLHYYRVDALFYFNFLVGCVAAPQVFIE